MGKTLNKKKTAYTFSHLPHFALLKTLKKKKAALE